MVAKSHMSVNAVRVLICLFIKAVGINDRAEIMTYTYSL